MRYITLWICYYFIFPLCFINQADAAQKLLEDWDTAPALDAAWGRTDIHDQNIDVMGGELHHLLRPYSTLSTSNNLTTYNAFPSTTANNLTAFQAKIRIEAIGDISSAPEIEFAATDFFGVYYNVNTEPTNASGDIYFVVRFGDRGNGLEAWYILTRIDESDYTDLATGNFTPPTGGWQIATDYILSVTYDGNNTFVATLGGQPTDITPVVGPARGFSATWAGKSIRTRVRLNGPFTGDAEAFAIHTVLDDIYIDTGAGLSLHDDFNDADQSLSTDKWDSNTLVRQSQVTDQMLKMRLKAAAADTVVDNGFRYTVGLPSEYQNTDFLQVDMMIAGNAMVPAARARVAVGGIFGNGKYSTAGNGNDGAIQFNANVEKRVNSSDYRVICNSFMEGENLDAEVEIMWEHVPALPDTWYTATLSIIGNTLHCQIAERSTGAVILSTAQDVTAVGISAIAPVGETRELFVRDIYAPAEVIGYYDNVYVKGGKLGDINQDDAINLSDAIFALQITGGLNPLIPRLATGTDVDGDSRIGLAESVYALQVSAQLIDITPPVTVDGPSASDTSHNNTILAATINEDGTGYYLVQDAGIVAPSPSAVEQANNSFPMTSNVQATVTISDLSESTDYKIYFIAKDTASNLQSFVQVIDITTSASPIDTTPEPFSFSDVFNRALRVLVTSNAITVTGINTAVAVTVTGGEYQINSGAWLSTAGTVTTGQTVRVRHLTSGSSWTTMSTVLSIGGISDTFSSTTLEGIPLNSIEQGGLTWIPTTDVKNNWVDADDYCNNAIINNLSDWRLPTRSELVSLYNANLFSGMSWKLGDTWSSTTAFSPGYHYSVLLNLYGYPAGGRESQTADWVLNYVTCVR